jgi:hypothetical protein
VRTLWKRLLSGAFVIVLTLLAGAFGATPVRAAETPFNWFDVTMRVPWRAAHLSDDVVCPGGVINFDPYADDAHGIAVRHGFLYLVRPLSEADITGDGHPDTVVEMFCGPAGPQQGSFYDPARFWYFVYSIRHGRPVLRGYLTSSDAQANALWSTQTLTPRAGAVDVNQLVRLPEGGFAFYDRTFRWTGHGFVADRPLPYHPEADRRP